MKATLKKLLLKFYARDIIIYVIQKAEKEGWTRGINLPEEEIADFIVDWLNGRELNAQEVYVLRDSVKTIVGNI